MKSESCALVIFGAYGDLTTRKLIPAIYNLRKAGLLPDEFAIIGNSRQSKTPSDVRAHLVKGLENHFPKGSLDIKIRDWITERVEFVAGDSTHEETHKKISEALDKNQKARGISKNAIFYLATPPDLFSGVAQALGHAGLLAENDSEDSPHWRRLVVEKPFGRDLESAKKLNHDLRQVLREDQIYRIDHYLGKETVQNLMVLRFANGIFEPIWNRRYIDSVQITVAEAIGVENRGSYYESSGALRDMVPNHLCQLVSLIAMEPPNSFDADDVRSEKTRALRAIKPLSHEDVIRQVVRGQYSSGRSTRGIVAAYRQEPHVAHDSQTETFVAMKLEIDNWRWAGVPFYLRTGKRMTGQLTEVVIRFRQAPVQMFRKSLAGQLDPNFLILQIQPDERIQIRFEAKVPGPGVRLGDATMSFNYLDRFGAVPQTGYETLLFDCIKGDATLFQRNDQIEAGWEIVTPILDVWKALVARDFPNYEPGTWGPARADELLRRDGREWLAINCCETDAGSSESEKRGAA